MSVVARILRFNAGRDPQRLHRKYQSMAADAFAFLRGSCHLFYEDWPQESPLNDAPLAWICGDLHLENLGAFKGDNRQVYFDLNDFDEAVLAPATWDLVRLLTSLWVAAPGLEFSPADTGSFGPPVLAAYSQALRSGKARWVERETATGIIQELLEGLRDRTRPQFLDRYTQRQHSQRRFDDDGKHRFALTGAQVERLRDFMEHFAAQQPHPAFFQCLDVAGRIAGLGSLGLERYVFLVEGKGSPDHHYLLDLKQVQASALQPYLHWPQPAWPTPAERVVAIQERVQAIAPAFLHAVTLDGKAFVLKALQPQDDRLELQSCRGHRQRFTTLLVTLGQLVAWAHLRSAGRQGSAIADEWIAFGARQDWHAPLLDYAQSYSQQVQEDWTIFREACKNGELDATESGTAMPPR